MSNLFTQGHALLIGVGGDLPGTVQDAEGLGKMLQDPEYCGYPSDQVKALTAEKATRQHILDGLAQLAQTTNDDAMVVVYFSGHGYQVKSSMGTAYFLMPHGYSVDDLAESAVSGQELANALKAIPHQKLLLLLDCCHAGGLDNLKAPGITFTESPIPPEAQAMQREGSGRVVIASSTAEQKSFAGKPYSAFTLALMLALAGEGASRQDGFVRVADLAMVTGRIVAKRTKDRQTPILNFEQSDNYVVSYYAGGEPKPKGLLFKEEPIIEDEPGEMARQGVSYQASMKGDGVIVQGEGNQVATGGGVVIGGNVHTGGGDFVGRDKVVHGDIVHGDKVGGDKVKGDKITVGEGGTAAVGKGATAVGPGGVNVKGDVKGSINTGTNIGKIEAGIVNQGGIQKFEAPIEIDMSETKIESKGDVVQGDQFVMSGNFRGAIVNVKSKLDNVTQTINALPYGDDEQKQEFNKLIEQLKAELDKVPPEHIKDAEKVTKRVEALTRELDEEEPDKEMVGITGESLKKAAQNIAGVLPTVISISTQIVAAALAFLA